MKKQKTDLQIKKDEIRKQILEKRSNLSLEEVDKKSELIIKNLSPYLKNAQNIMIFMDMKNEVRITKLLEFYPKKNFFIFLYVKNHVFFLLLCYFMLNLTKFLSNCHILKTCKILLRNVVNTGSKPYF